VSEDTTDRVDDRDDPGRVERLVRLKQNADVRRQTGSEEIVVAGQDQPVRVGGVGANVGVRTSRTQLGDRQNVPGVVSAVGEGVGDTGGDVFVGYDPEPSLASSGPVTASVRWAATVSLRRRSAAAISSELSW